MTIDKILHENHGLAHETVRILLEQGKTVRFSKNQRIISEGRLALSSFIIISGCAKAHMNLDGKDINFWFGFEGDFLLSYNSKILNKPGYESITALENCTLWEVANHTLEELCLQNLEVANWMRKLAETELIKTEKRLINRQTKEAKTRYEELITQYPQVLERISLGNIASYLGINQVSLSRIRSQIK
ncbi:Crp/Fnr family transcriptional regulator [Echinicola sediminis]